MSRAISLRDILSEPFKFKVCMECGSIALGDVHTCDCGCDKFNKAVKATVEREVKSLQKIYNLSRERALDVEFDVY